MLGLTVFLEAFNKHTSCYIISAAVAAGLYQLLVLIVPLRVIAVDLFSALGN